MGMMRFSIVWFDAKFVCLFVCNKLIEQQRLIFRNNEECYCFSSFDEYHSEVVSRRLEWSPVHKSEKFWRENASRLNEKNYELLKFV